MNDKVEELPVERTYRSRTGITALNLILPGLGLLRLGNWRSALVFLVAPFGLALLIILGMGHFPVTGYASAIIALAVVSGFAAALYIVPAVLTWRESRVRSSTRPWSRWYSLTIITVIITCLFHVTPSLLHRFYKPFYAPSESMAPTIGKSDKFIADMRWRGPFRRGEIMIFNGPDGIRVSRIAALPGDRIAMRAGVPIVNGEPALQAPAGRTTFLGYDGLQSAAMLTERLPGEMSVHHVLDLRPSEFDDTQEIVVPSKHLFVLGDNRDDSADSRVPPELSGAGMVPFSSVIGRPMYIHWSSDHSKIGARLDR